MAEGKIVKVSGPLVVAEGIPNARLYDTVRVSDMALLGEIIEVDGDLASIQVYEETSGLRLNQPVVSDYQPLSIALGPGLLASMLDGIGRNLLEFADLEGNYLTRGTVVGTLDTKRHWKMESLVEVGDQVSEGDYLGYVKENEFKHYILVPVGVSGVVQSISDKPSTVIEPVVTIKTKTANVDVQMMQYWPIRKSRPYQEKHLPHTPLVTGQRIIDTFFPVTKGGTACVPGPFGSGKTVVQHQLAKWSDSDVVVYIGCGERGNEMTDVLLEFPEIIDPRTNHSIMEKTVLIANTSNMPVAAREASIYTGITIAEYFRDMGYDVTLLADSTSRWAEALREMSGRLEEMPGDEGYPAYLGSRLAQVYERAGVVDCFSTNPRRGSVTMIGAVSPAGGDLSEPVTQATLKIVKVFWALDAKLAYARHFPAINWLNSYSLYQDDINRYLRKNTGRNFPRNRKRAMMLLKEEEKLQEVVQLIGKDALSDVDLLKLEVARMLREDFLQQNAFVEVDTYTSLRKQSLMLAAIVEFFNEARDALVHDHVYIADILNMEAVYELSQMKYLPEEEVEQISQLIDNNRLAFEELSYDSKGEQSLEGV